MKQGWKKVFMIGALCISFAGNSLSVQAEEYEYDALNRVTKVTYEDGSYILYEYDSNGNLLRVVVEEAGTGESESEVSGTEAADSQGTENEKGETGKNETSKNETGKKDSEKTQDENKVSENSTSSSGQEQENPEEKQKADTEGVEAEKASGIKEMPGIVKKIGKIICAFLLIVLKIYEWLESV